MSVQVADEDKLKFAMVPFAAFVNVGPDYGPKFTKKGKGVQVAGSGAEWLDLRATVEMQQWTVDGASRFQLYRNLGRNGRAASRRATPPATTRRRRYAGRSRKSRDAVHPDFRYRRARHRRFANSYIKSDAKPNDKSAKEKAPGRSTASTPTQPELR